MSNQRPSFFRVISTDYPSFLSFLFPVAFGGFSAYFFFTGNDAFRLFIIPAIGAIVFGIPFLIKRYRMISTVFQSGIQTQGKVTGIGFFRGQGRVEFTYTVDGKKQSSSNAINRNSHTRKLSVGQKVKVLVDRSDAERAFIQDIYL